MSDIDYDQIRQDLEEFKREHAIAAANQLPNITGVVRKGLGAYVLLQLPALLQALQVAAHSPETADGMPIHHRMSVFCVFGSKAVELEVIGYREIKWQKNCGDFHIHALLREGVCAGEMRELYDRDCYASRETAEEVAHATSGNPR